MKEKVMDILMDLRSDVDFENETKLIADGILESFDGSERKCRRTSYGRKYEEPDLCHWT